ncbi:MAG: hypothetical protein ACEQSB_06185 [Undibacterium sp.]
MSEIKKRPAVFAIAEWIATLTELKEESGAADVSLVFRYPDGKGVIYSTDESIDENELDFTGMEQQ